MELETKEAALQRLRSIEGHIRGIQRMLEEDRDCVDVIRQTLAVKRALDRVGQLLVTSHLRTCMTSGSRSLEAAERALQELLDMLELSERL